MEMLFWLMSISMLTFMFMEHPMSMGLILLTQTILISMSTGIIGINSWLSYILFLVMVGGMLILFTYMTSVASNEMFKYSNKLLIALLSSMMGLIYYMKNKSMLTYFKFNNTETIKFNDQEIFSMILLKYLSFPMMMLWMMLIIYLLITMIAVVKITVIKYGPLQQLN